MATTNTDSAERTEPPARMIRPRRPRGEAIVDWLTTTDHKVIGNLYLVTVVRLLPARRGCWPW